MKLVVCLVVLGALLVVSMAPRQEAEPAAVSVETILMVVGGVLAVALEIVPGVKTRWQGLPDEAKRFAWLVGCFVVGVGPPVLACIGARLGLDLSASVAWMDCSVGSLGKGMEVAAMAYFASQSAHGATLLTLKGLGKYDNGGR